VAPIWPKNRPLLGLFPGVGGGKGNRINGFVRSMIFSIPTASTNAQNAPNFLCRVTWLERHDLQVIVRRGAGVREAQLSLSDFERSTDETFGESGEVPRSPILTI
jgi:hypothetical protein